MATEIYEKTVINYIWYIEFERVNGGVKLLRHYRKRYDDPTRPEAIGKGGIIEDRMHGQRTAIAVEITPYNTPLAKPEQLTVINPKPVFDYGRSPG